MGRWIWVLALAGCDALFGIHAIPEARPDGASDGPVLADHDEDGDGVDDAIDNCPADFNDQTDLDGDGVGEACDPHPGVADRIRYFDPLITFPPGTWTVIAGTWTADGDTVTQRETTNNELALLTLGSELVDPTIEVVIDAIVGTYGGVYLVTGGTGALPDGVGCYVDANMNELLIYDRGHSDNSTGVSGSMYPVRVRVQASAADATSPPICIAERAGATPVSITHPSLTAPVASAQVALYTFLAQVTYESVTVYDRAP